MNKINKTKNKIRSFLQGIYLKNSAINLYQIFKIFIKKINEDEIFERSLAVAFSFTLGAFPFIIFLFALIPYINIFIPEINSEKIMGFLNQIMPSNMYDITKETILDLVSIKRGGLLSFGVLAALFLSTNGFNTLIKTFNSCYKLDEQRGFFKTRFTALILTLIFLIVAIFSILLSTVGAFFTTWLNSNNYFFYDFFYYTYIYSILILFIIFYLVITSIYYFAPVIHNKWKFFSSGSTIASIGCVLITLLFSFYLNNFSTYNKIYGSIGVLIAFMSWVYLISSMLLIGFEWNTSIDIALKKNKK